MASAPRLGDASVQSASSMTRPPGPIAAAAMAFGLAFAGRKLLGQLHKIDLRGQVVLITGGSRGLGLAIARELARKGSRLVLCARNADELERARQSVAELGAEVFALTW